MAHSRFWALALLVLLLAACRRPSPPPFDYDAMLGVAVEKTDRACLDIRNHTLAAGQRLRLVTASSSPSISEAEITGKASQACTTVDQNQPGVYHYEFKIVRGSLQNAVPAFAVVNGRGSLTVASTGVTGDLDGDGQPESFRSCTSSEGVHLTVWTGKPLEGRRRWHRYYYLGYDVEPDCTEADTQPDNP